MTTNTISSKIPTISDLEAKEVEWFSKLMLMYGGGPVENADELIGKRFCFAYGETRKDRRLTRGTVECSEFHPSADGGNLFLTVTNRRIRDQIILCIELLQEGKARAWYADGTLRKFFSGEIKFY